MRVLDPGHTYRLDALDGDRAQTLRFVKREGVGYPGNVGAQSGATMQEVMRCLIDRARYVNGQFPCPETEAIIGLLVTAILLLESRAKRRKGRHLEETTLAAIEGAPCCAVCGHISCVERH